MESSSYSSKFVSVLFDDRSNSSAEGLLFEKVVVQGLALSSLSFQLFLERIYSHGYKFVVS